MKYEIRGVKEETIKSYEIDEDKLILVYLG